MIGRSLTTLLAALLAVLMLFSACDRASGAETTAPSSETTLPAPTETGDPTETDESVSPEETTAPEGDATTEGHPPVTVPDGPEPADLIDRYSDFALSMESAWALKTHTDANGVNCRVIQGGCTDGTYLYVAFNDGGSKNENSISAIRKYHIASRSLVATFENLKISHANDMTFNPETNEILIVHNSPDRRHVSFYDADSLEFKEMITVDLDIYSMAYDPYEQCYWVGISFGYTFAKLDFDFKQVGEIYQGRETGYTKQGMDIDSKYIYFLQYNKNAIIMYNKAGEFVKEVPLPKTNHEPENICHIGDSFYIGYLESGGGTMYHVTVGEKGAVNPDPVTVTMEKIGTLPVYKDSKGNTMGMAQGMCTDGTYLYIAMNNGDSALSAICKVDPETGAILATYEGIKAGLTNDLAYNPSTKEIVAVHNGNERNKISVYKASDLSHVKTVTLEMNIYAMAYDSTKNCFLVGVSNGYDYAYLDLNFKKISDIKPGKTFSNTKQGIHSSADGFCLILSGDNTLAWYRPNGTYLGIGRFADAEKPVQSICSIGDTYYIVASNNSGGVLYRAVIEIKEP
jgi:hypothetical protein